MDLKAPPLAVMIAPLVMLRMDQATSAEVRARPSWKRTLGRRWKTQVSGSGRSQEGGEPGLEVEVRVFADEGVVDEGADALRLGVGALADVEVVGGGLDEEGERVVLRGR